MDLKLKKKDKNDIIVNIIKSLKIKVRIMNVTLYRKYRPQNFDEIAGQEYVTRAIKNSLSKNRLSHAYLFTGPRGVGKTTIARLIAKGINCLNNGISDNPCGVCENCTEIAQGISMDMIEIDAASNRGIDEIRELKEKINYQPVKGRKRIYIIDEVHMLTKEAFNALLKTLEEPPSHVIFILATTEIDKIPDTVVSRCQRYDFIPIEKESIISLLRGIAVKENIDIDDESLEIIYRKSEGSARDSFSIFEQVVSNFNGEDIDISKTQKALGVVPDIILNDFLQLIKKGDKVELIGFVDKIWEMGVLFEIFLKDFAYYLKEQYKKGVEELSADFILSVIGSIFFILNEFKYEEDKRLLGYVFVYELYKKKINNPAQVRSKGQHDMEIIQDNHQYSANADDMSIEKDMKIDKDKIRDGARISSSPDFSIFEKKWNDIKAEMKNREAVINALMMDTYPERLENNTLIIKFPVGNKFHRENIMQPDKKHKTENIINRICGTDIRIKGELEGDDRKSSENEFVNKVLDFFDGEILEKR